MLYVVATKILRALIPEDQAAEPIQPEMARAQLFIEKNCCAHSSVGQLKRRDLWQQLL